VYQVKFLTIKFYYIQDW